MDHIFKVGDAVVTTEKWTRLARNLKLTCKFAEGKITEIMESHSSYFPAVYCKVCEHWFDQEDLQALS